MYKVVFKDKLENVPMLSKYEFRYDNAARVVNEWVHIEVKDGDLIVSAHNGYMGYKSVEILGWAKYDCLQMMPNAHMVFGCTDEINHRYRVLMLFVQLVDEADGTPGQKVQFWQHF